MAAPSSGQPRLAMVSPLSSLPAPFQFSSSSSPHFHTWTRQDNDDLLFENSLAVHEEHEAPNRWETDVAALIPPANPIAAYVKRHFEILQEDNVSREASGRILMPSYTAVASPSISDDVPSLGQSGFQEGRVSSREASGLLGSPSLVRPGVTPKSADQERRKGIPWTEEEHRLVSFGILFYTVCRARYRKA